MSKLVERVKAAISETSSSFYSLPADNPEWMLHHAQARAAIAAVAEWMIDEFSYQAEMIEIKRAIVAALRAAAEGEK